MLNLIAISYTIYTLCINIYWSDQSNHNYPTNRKNEQTNNDNDNIQQQDGDHNDHDDADKQSHLLCELNLSD